MARLESKKKKKNTKKFAFIFLFSVTFIVTLFLVGAMFKNFSPPVDVNIGSQEVTESNDDIDDFQQGDVDNRLKWIQFEDNMSESPVAQEVSSQKSSETAKTEFSDEISNWNKKQNTKSQEDELGEPPLPIPVYKKKVPTASASAPVPSVNEIRKNTKPAGFSKVYVGYYSTL